MFCLRRSSWVRWVQFQRSCSLVSSLVYATFTFQDIPACHKLFQPNLESRWPGNVLDLFQSMQTVMCSKSHVTFIVVSSNCSQYFCFSPPSLSLPLNIHHCLFWVTTGAYFGCFCLYYFTLMLWLDGDKYLCHLNFIEIWIFFWSVKLKICSFGFLWFRTFVFGLILFLPL